MDHAVRFVKTRNPVSNVLARLLTFWKLIRGLAKLLVSVSKLKFFSSILSVYFAHPIVWVGGGGRILWQETVDKYVWETFLRIGNNFLFAAC